jgi:hypothetical protein
MTGRSWMLDRVLGDTSGGRTNLRHLDADAELYFSGGRLTGGRRYRSAPTAARHELARTGAILRLRERNRYFVHAAAVVHESGGCVLLLGDSGVGKSTIAYALHRAGWQLLGDDGVVLEPAEKGVVAHQWRRPAMVSVGLAAHFPELAGHSAHDPADPRGRASVEIAHARRAPVVSVVVLERGEPGVLERLPASSALREMMRQSPWVLLGDEAAPAHFHALARAVSRASTWRLVHGPAQLSRVHRMLSGVVR